MAENLTDLQKKALEIAKKYEGLSMQDKIGIIAQAFGATSGKIETSVCYGEWRGTSDMSIRFDNGLSLFLGNKMTPQAKSAKVQDEYVSGMLTCYNPEIIALTKETALAPLRKREAVDNAIAAQKGLNPYTVLNVELNDGAKNDLYIGWYYVTLAVDGKIHAHLETELAHGIKDGTVSEIPTREKYFAAGALKDTDVDYVFYNVGFSLTGGYTLPITKEVLERAEKTLAERQAAERPQTRKPSLREQLAAAKAALTERPAAQRRQKIMEAR